MGLSTGESGPPIDKIIPNLIVDLRKGRYRPSDVSFDSNLSDSHILSDFGVGVTRSVGKIDLSRARIHRVQKSIELIQALLVIENLIWSWTWGYQGVPSVNVLDLHFAT